MYIIINRILTVGLTKFHSHFHALCHKLPNYKSIKVFGCACFPFTRSYNKHKLEYRSQKCVYLGVTSLHKDFKCLNKSYKVSIYNDLVFNEHHFAFLVMFQTNITCTSQHSYGPKLIAFPQLSTKHTPNITATTHMVTDSIPQVVRDNMSPSSPTQVSQSLIQSSPNSTPS